MSSHPLPLSSRPFLKWVGGKSRLLPSLLPLLPPGKRLIEPFVGAGAVFLAANYLSYVINDDNPDLIATWVALKERPAEFVYRAATFFAPWLNTQEAYERIRGEFNVETDRFERAVRLPYLNKLGFNGLYRVNSKGGFNVPYARPTKMPAFPWHEMFSASQKLEHCTVLGGGFKGAMEIAGEGDVVYCDPPYLESTKGDSYVGYTKSGFKLEDHVSLLREAEKAVVRGATVLISNHDTSETRLLYSGWEVHAMTVSRTIAGKGGSRGTAAELVAIKGARNA